MKNLFLFGGGGHCNSCIDVILSENKYKIVAIIDDKINLNKKFNIKIENSKYFKKNKKKKI